MTARSFSIRIVAFAGFALVFAGCGGGGGSSSPGLTGGPLPSISPTPCPAGYAGTAPNCSLAQLSGIPSSGIAFASLGASAAASVNVTQAVPGKLAESDTCASVAPVTVAVPSPAPSTAALDVSITPAGPGTCTITLRGVGGVSANVPINVSLTDVTPNVAWNSSIGPVMPDGSGKLNSFIIDPTAGAVMYVAGGVGADDEIPTSAGVYKSANAGATWSSADSGLSDTTVNALWMDPANSQTLIAATQFGGIFRSTDGAASWQPVSPQSPVASLVASNGTLFAVGSGGVATSTDDGVSWRLAYPISGMAESIAIAGSTLYIGDQAGNLYLSQNGAAPAKIYTFPADPTATFSPDVHALAADVASPGTLYAAIRAYSNNAFSGTLYASTDGGLQWTQIPIASGARGAQMLAMSAVTPHQLYVLGTECLSSLNPISSLSLCGYYGDGRGLTAAANVPAADIPVDAGGSEPLLATGDQGAYIGSASGAGRNVTAGLSVNIVRSVAVSGSTIATTMQDWSPHGTMNGGQTWSALDADSSENGFLYGNPSHRTQCYLFDTFVHISTDGCQTFDNTDHGYGGYSGGTTLMAFDPSAVPRAYLVTASGVYVTNDGATFAPTGWPIANAANIAVDPLNPKDIYVSSGNQSSGSTSVHYSNDGGATWNVSTGITPHSANYSGDAPVIAVSPTHDNIVFAGTGTEIYRSIDGGKTFTSLQTYQPQAVRVKDAQRRVLQLKGGVRDDDMTTAGRLQSVRTVARGRTATPTTAINVGETLAFADNTPAGAVAPLVYVLPSRELLMSTDYGGHWHDVSANAISRWFSQVVFSSGTMYTATIGNGVIVSANPVAGAAAARRQRFSLALTRRPR